MRYVYGLTTALLLGGAAASLATGPAGAQTAQNARRHAAAAPRARRADVLRRPRRPAAAGGGQHLDQAAIRSARTDQLPPASRNSSASSARQSARTRATMAAAAAAAAAHGRARASGSLGSGFLISPDGYIVTNNHVISPALHRHRHGRHGHRHARRPQANIRRGSSAATRRRRSRAAQDRRAGPAVRAIRRFSTQARVGDWVLAIGNPFGLGGTVTAGIISALHRNLPSSGAYDRYIQTDAAINMGNSGGPMFDLNGNVIGINTALYSPTGGNVGIGFAIPAEQAKPVIDALMRGERVRARLSRRQPAAGRRRYRRRRSASPRIRARSIRGVTPGGPAARAGIQQGDVDRRGQRPAGHARPDACLSRRATAGRLARADRR